MDDELNLSGAEDELINPINLFANEEADENNDEENDGNNVSANNDEAATAAGAPGVTPAPKKRRTIKRHPNLNEGYLAGGVGEQTMYKANSYFEDIKFSKGHNSEEKNLNKILRRYEYFAQQCYPKLCFRDFVEKVEKLSKKKMIRHALLSIRKEGNNNDIINSDTEDNPGNNDPAGNATENIAANNHSFDDVFQNSTVSENEENLADRNKENIKNQNTTLNSINENDSHDTSIEKPVITEEMRELMLKKRLEAIEKRKRKLEQASQEQPQSQSQDS